MSDVHGSPLSGLAERTQDSKEQCVISEKICQQRMRVTRKGRWRHKWSISDNWTTKKYHKAQVTLPFLFFLKDYSPGSRGCKLWKCHILDLPGRCVASSAPMTGRTSVAGPARPALLRPSWTSQIETAFVWVQGAVYKYCVPALCRECVNNAILRCRWKLWILYTPKC